MSRKVLTIDIETSPHLAYTFQTWNTNIRPYHIVEPSRMLCFAAKWEDKPRVIFESEFAPFNGDPGFEMSQDFHHLNMVQQAFALLDEADVVVTYNGDKFDLRRLGQEFRLAGLGQPSPYVSVDLYKVIKKEEEWASHKLSYITEQYRLTGKLEDGVDFALWRGCLEGDLKSWRIMRRYNKGDVVTTEELKLAAHDIVKMPALSLYDDEPIGEGECPTCRRPAQRRGYAYTATRRYPRYYCPVDMKWFSGNRSDRSAGIR